MPRLPDNTRVYAVGDIHGRLDLFRQMIERIDADDAARGNANSLVILLGDLVDRGPHSAGVIAAAREWRQRRPVRILMGNHEEMFLRAMDDPVALRHFLRVGGRETILSYGIPLSEYRGLSIKELHERLPALVPQADIDFISGMENLIALGDYVFVHAGIDPSRTIETQVAGDVRWIREPFLSHPQSFEFCVVHGHTIRETVDIHAPRRWPNRIGIDTGAFRTGNLTAIGLQDTDRWFMEATV
ncbi:metallophosphoesterase family protein [Croceicoccus bisphenolivorans]|uniref:metallophosphoesterase family protein n=1 Tax=Croceicoccus bisphenolivorans TaxID=1783232 RepID=UPI00082BE8F1|nr:metallophosphoesterase family protein [Croceicoccus bisphenolivorans]